jgi:hypothetical protein
MNQLCRHFNEPQKHHWRAALQVLAYLKGTQNHGVVFSKEKEAILTGWTDADWAGDKEDRKSTGGYLFKMGRAIISYGCRKHKTTATSSTAAEVMQLSAACKEAMWQVKIFKALFGKDHAPVRIFEDNDGAVGAAKHKNTGSCRSCPFAPNNKLQTFLRSRCQGNFLNPFVSEWGWWRLT